MTAYNSVRFRVKPGREQAFIEAHHRAKPHDWPGFRRGALIRTGERTYCFVGEWESMAAMAAARALMIAVLDSFRDTLEDQGPGIGATDPVSGDAVVDYPARG
jgi:hypothetical protein